MAQRIQQAPPRRRPTAIKANPTQAPTPLDLSPPPIAEGVDAVVGWINRLNLQTIDLAQHQPQKHKALQALVAAFGRCRATARDVALLLQAREQRDHVPAAGAYATEPPLTDGLAMPLWHAFELVRLLYLVAQAPDVDKEDVAAIQTRIRHHVSGVTVREADATADFKRRHRIGSDVAGAVAGYAQIQAQLEKEALTAGDAEDARSDLIAFGHFMKSDYTSPWHVQVVCDALMRAERREVKGLIINMPPRRSKPVWEEELVLRADGQRVRLKDIDVGDVLISGSGVARRVTAVHIQGELPTLVFETRGGRSLCAAIDHPFLTPEGWKTADSLRVGDYLAVLRDMPAMADSSIPIAEFALAGYLLGDGSVSEQNATFTNADLDIVADATQVAGEVGFNLKPIKSSKYGYGLSSKDNHHKPETLNPRKWIRLRKIGGNSYTKTVPAWVFSATPDRIARYIGAYFACDGCVDSCDTAFRITFCSVSKTILDAIQHLLLRFRITSSIRLRTIKYKGEMRPYYILTISGQHNVALFAKQIPVAGRKGEKLKKGNPKLQGFDGLLAADDIVKISNGGLRPCRCLTIDTDHTFTISDVVVKNSTNATELFPAWLLGRHPTWDIIVGTHSQHFADSLGRKVRNMIQAAEYRRVFQSISVAQDSSAAAQFEIVDETASARQRRGNFKAFGRGGAPAGSGANCFPAGTQVSTEVGLIPIEQLVQMGYNTPRVLSYDHKRKSPVWAKVLASSQRRAKGLVELTTSAGRRVVATPEHLVYSAGTWTEAKDLQPGNGLVAIGLSGVEDDTVSMVRPLCDTEVDVYDIQVADHSCFFAESILVHNCLILDDFLSEQDAYSATERAKLLDDIIAFRTRLAPDAIWIVINTRYHEDDVVGVVKRDFADDREWTVITLPEFAEADEEWVVTTPATARRPAQRRVYTRKAGDVLWPDRFSAESSEQLKAALLKVAPHKWWGQFQCRPVPASGAMVDVSWFRRYDYADVMSIVKQAARVVVSVDCGGVKLHSRGSGAYGSRTAITVWAEWEDGRLYLIDINAAPWIYPDMIQAVKDACANWKPTDLLIENKAAGVELIRDLHEHRNWVQTPITPIDPFGPKETRMSVATPQIRAGQVYIPAQGACADIAAVRCAAPAWLEEFLTEMGHFPMGSRNDLVDSSSQMLNWRRDSPVWSNFSQVTASSPMKDQLMRAIAGPFGQRGGSVGVRPTMRIGSPRRPG